MSLNDVYAVTKEALGHSNQASQQALLTWRSLGTHLAHRSQCRVARQMRQHRLPLVGRELQDMLAATHAQFVELCAAAWALPAARGSAWVDRIDRRLNRQMDRVTDVLTLVEAPVAVKAVDLMCSAMLPAARMARTLAKAAQKGGHQVQARWCPELDHRTASTSAKRRPAARRA